MRAKLLALREGRIPSDEEVIPILEDRNIAATAAQEDRDTSARPENNVPEEDVGDEEDDNQVEGENEEEEDEKVEYDQEFKDRLEELMKDLVKPPQEHLSILPHLIFPEMQFQLPRLFREGENRERPRRRRKRLPVDVV